MDQPIYLKNPKTQAPISRAVGVPSTSVFYQLGAQFPEVSDASAPPDSIQSFGDTYTQTKTTLQRLSSLLSDLGLGKTHLTNMRIHLVGETEGERMDVAAFNKAYNEYFADQSERFPSRTVMQVAALVNPGWLIEIEATAAK